MKNFFIKYYKYILVVVAIALVAGLGSLFVNLGQDWFNTLRCPAQFPPNFIIPVVWSVIYLAFAIILCIWLSRENISKRTLGLLITNGILNVLWCLIFFTFNLTFLGQVFIVLNLIFAILLVINIYKQKPLYSYILSIYPIWVTIATCLNLALWILN